jgi:hypothetical protein
LEILVPLLTFKSKTVAGNTTAATSATNTTIRNTPFIANTFPAKEIEVKI